MDVPGLLEAASLLVPESTATDDDLTVRDVWDCLVRDDWEFALNLLEEHRGGPALPLAFWETLADAAGRLRMERSTAWCRWRAYETRNGVIRAELALAEDPQRRTPVPGAGVLRPLWDIGHRTPTGETAFAIASLWVEGKDALEPGGRATIRIAPLTPSLWGHLRPGQPFTMHEQRPVAGTAVVLEVRPPVTADGEGKHLVTG
ncbi:hypothetical protein [Streptomyces sp. NPDC037389]|uniref:hypothetical protein n=1 Tax=Streptomyces sp. NPDC037389 TaxID=3155369 RepID=UPI0033F49F22